MSLVQFHLQCCDFLFECNLFCFARRRQFFARFLERGVVSRFLLLGFLLRLFDFAAGALFLSHLLANLPLLFLYLLALFLVLVRAPKFVELQLRIPLDDLAVVRLAQLVDSVERPPHAFLERSDVVVSNLRDRRVTLAIERTEHEAKLPVRHRSTFGDAALDLPLY